MMSGTWTKRLAVGGLGILAAMTLVMGGCNNDTKAENERLTTENTGLRTENERLKDTVASHSQQISSLSQQLNSRPAPAPAYEPMADQGGTTRSRASRTGEDVVITVAGDVLFGSGQATIQAGARKELDSVAAQLKGKYAGHTVRVEGYTDSDPIKKSKFGSNEALSQARAEAVEKYLISKGVSASRISAVGMGSAKPKGTKKDSRRVEIVVLGN
ncbi:MAG: OmpA family protein [Phycisphaerae bacterium]|nr:OmpA family protein [Phycisphaerae bacterium]